MDRKLIVDALRFFRHEWSSHYNCWRFKLSQAWFLKCFPKCYHKCHCKSFVGLNSWHFWSNHCFESSSRCPLGCWTCSFKEVFSYAQCSFESVQSGWSFDEYCPCYLDGCCLYFLRWPCCNPLRNRLKVLIRCVSFEVGVEFLVKLVIEICFGFHL